MGASTTLIEIETIDACGCEWTMTVEAVVFVGDKEFQAEAMTYTIVSPSQTLGVTLTYLEVTVATVMPGELVTFVFPRIRYLLKISITSGLERPQVRRRPSSGPPPTRTRDWCMSLRC